MKRFLVVLCSIVLISPMLAQSAAESNSPLWGKKMVVIGDSYVRNHRQPIEYTWHSKLAARYNMSYENFGRNGNCIAFDRRNWGKAMLNRYVDMPDSADYVVVIAGHNDADYIDLIDVADSVKQNMTDAERLLLTDSLKVTFLLRLDEFIVRLQTKYPKSHIVFVSPWSVDRPGFSFVLQGLRSACDRRGVAFYDAARLSGIEVLNPDFRAQYFQRQNDTAHLNAAGHDLMLPKMDAFFSALK